jgi:hypothetical protein
MRVDKSWLDITGQTSKKSHQILSKFQVDESNAYARVYKIFTLLF